MTTIHASPSMRSIGARCFLHHLHDSHPTKVDPFQTKLREITDSVTENVASGIVNLYSLDIRNIVCVLPKDGVKAIVVTRAYGDHFKPPTGLNMFTGSEWNIDLKRMKGHIGNVSMSVENIIVELIKNTRGHWELTNVIPKPSHNCVSLKNPTQLITISHLVGAITSASLIDSFSKGDASGYSLYASTDDEEFDETRHILMGSMGTTMATDAIMSCSPMSIDTMSPVRKNIIPLPPASIVADDGEESKFGDGDRFAAYIASVQPIFSKYMKVFGSDRENFVIVIGKNGEEHLWTKCDEHWDTLIQCFANVCATTL